MKVAVLGYGRQGQSGAEYWNAQGNEVTICDQNVNLSIPSWAKSKLGDNHLTSLNEFDLIVRSPIIHPSLIVEANSLNILDKVTTTTNEFLKVCPTNNIIGVTGTKGKGTSCTLISKMLEADGKKVHLGGNIGLDPLVLLRNNIQPDDWVVLELANFQLIDLKHSPHIAVCLMVENEHLDWHKDLEEYLLAKQQLFINQTTNDIAIYYPDNANSVQIASVSKGQRIPYFKQPGAFIKDDAIFVGENKICNLEEIKLPGKHNWQNVCAATTAVWQVTQNVGAIKKAISEFSGLPHRIEKIRVVEGVTYYNDSFATGQSATIAAIKAVKGSKVLILGGFDRNLNLDKLFNELELIKDEIRFCLLIGQTAQKLRNGLDSIGIAQYKISDASNMEGIVKESQSHALNGDSVVFSPGFASFGMFKNFEDRGDQYREQVNKL